MLKKKVHASDLSQSRDLAVKSLDGIKQRIKKESKIIGSYDDSRLFDELLNCQISSNNLLAMKKRHHDTLLSVGKIIVNPLII